MSVDRSGKVTRFTGLWIDDDGRVKQLLDRKDKRPRTRFGVDGQGRGGDPRADRFARPRDGHRLRRAHARPVADPLARPRRRPRSRAYAARNPDRRWIIGRGWNQETWGLGRFPTAAELDAAVADRPVLARAGRRPCRNGPTRAALKAAGITARPPTRPAGESSGWQARRRPPGVFVDNATDLVVKARARRRARRTATSRSPRRRKCCSRAGSPRWPTWAPAIEAWQAFRRAGDLGWLRVRIMAYAVGDRCDGADRRPGPYAMAL